MTNIVAPDGVGGRDDKLPTGATVKVRPDGVRVIQLPPGPDVYTPLKPSFKRIGDGSPDTPVLNEIEDRLGKLPQDAVLAIGPKDFPQEVANDQAALEEMFEDPSLAGVPLAELVERVLSTAYDFPGYRDEIVIGLYKQQSDPSKRQILSTRRRIQRTTDSGD